MAKTTKISWKDTNLALIGSELDHKIKQATAANEAEWVEGGGKNGIGKTPGLHVWRIEQFHVKAWPTEKYSQFHKGDSYIVLNSYRKGTSDALNHDLHIWIGQESSQDEYGTAAYKMVEADDYLGGVAIQHRQVQGHEDDLFKSYFEVMEYLEGGVESGFRHVEPDPQHPVLFQVKGGGSRVKTIMTLTQVPLSKSSLNAGDSFILYGGAAKVWCWHGASAKPLEKAHSNQWAEKMCTMGTVTTLDQDQGDEQYPEFWDLIGRDGDIAPYQEEEDEQGMMEFEPRLYRVDGDPQRDLKLLATASRMVHKKSSTNTKREADPCFKRTDLKDDDVFLIDSGWEIFVWIGSGADRSEKIAGMNAADRYSKLDPRTVELPVHIVKSGHESDAFSALFD